MAVTASVDVRVTVFCQNEAARIVPSLESLAVAGAGMAMAVTVIANGSRDESAALASASLRRLGLPGGVFTIAAGDKSNAINQSFHALRQPAGLYVFVDGYAIVDPRALRGLQAALAREPGAQAATGVAGNGRTMKAATEETLRDGGRLHGQLHAFRPAFLDRLAAGGLRLPVGLYRGDGLLGSMVCHDLDARGTPWDGHRIAAAAEALYHIPQLSPLRGEDIRRQFRRKIRQMRGVLENAAIKSVIYADGYKALPDNADDMIAAWLLLHPVPATSLLDRPFMAMALRAHARALARPRLGESLVPVAFS